MVESVTQDKKRQKAIEEHFKGRKAIDRKRILGSGLIDHMTKIERMITMPIVYFSDNDAESGVIFSLNNSHNILNQAGVFTWNADSTKPIEMVGNEEHYKSKKEDESADYFFCGCFNINKILEDHIRNRLEKDGITRELIYPTSGINAWDVFEKSVKNDND